VEHTSDGHGDVIMPVVTWKHISDGHDDVTISVATMIFLFEVNEFKNIYSKWLNH
jgi:hypothetical protein